MNHGPPRGDIRFAQLDRLDSENNEKLSVPENEPVPHFAKTLLHVAKSTPLIITLLYAIRSTAKCLKLICGHLTSFKLKPMPSL